MIIFTGALVMMMHPTRNPTGALGVVVTADAPDGASPPGDTGVAQDDATIAENDTSNSSGNISRDNQPPNERQTGGEAPADKRRRSLDRPRLRHAPPSQDLVATALALAAETAAALIADDADGGNNGVAIVGARPLRWGAG